ncbi:MAG: CBS domain-containing protein [Reyranella sp.]|uniref:CBS domain-containing protein n=1 Tax=Reyranella sp. TaxID=1929291 RepID=UPI003D0CD12B
MKASDVMVSPVITVKSTATVKAVARLFLDRRISAAPVVDDAGKLVGIVSEGDLIHRVEIGTERRRGSWLALLIDEHAPAADYIKSHAAKVGDIMTRKVVTATPDTPLQDVAMMMEMNGIKRIPVVRDGEMVGLVSRANLVQAVATAGTKLEIPVSDAMIRERLMSRLRSESWANTSLLNATVNDGVVTLWGLTDSPTERQAIRVAAEGTPGVVAVRDHIGIGRVTSI